MSFASHIRHFKAVLEHLVTDSIWVSEVCVWQDVVKVLQRQTEEAKLHSSINRADGLRA